MCVSLPVVFTIATVAASAVNAYASIQQGNAQYAAGMYNAQIAERNAQSVEEEKKNLADAAAIERRRLGEKIRAERGQKIADFAHMGLDTQFGTPADLIGDIERAGRADLSIIGRNEINSLKSLDKQQADFLSSAQLSRMEAKSARKAGQLGALGSLLGGASTVSSRWIRPPSTPIPDTPPQTSILQYPVPVGG